MQSCLKNSVIEYVESQPWAESTKKSVRHNLFKMYSISSNPDVVEKTLISRGYSRYTIKQYFIVAGGFDKSFRRHYESRKNLFKNAYKTKTRTIEETKVLEILNNSDQFFNIIYLMARCGLRLSEACSLKKTDEVSSNLFRVVGKGDKQRLVPCNTANLKPYKDVIAGDIEVSQLRRYLQRYGVTPHDLRAFFITSIARSRRLDLDEIQVVVGHSSLLTTQRYLRQNIDEIQAKLLGGTNGN